MKVIFKSVRDEKSNMNDFQKLYDDSIEVLKNLKEDIESLASGRSVVKLSNIIDDIIKSHEDMRDSANDIKKSLDTYIIKVLNTKKVTPKSESKVTLVETHSLKTKINTIKEEYRYNISKIYKLDTPSKNAISPFLDKETKEELVDYIDTLNFKLKSRENNIKIQQGRIKDYIDNINKIVYDIYNFEHDDSKTKRKDNHTVGKVILDIGAGIILGGVAVITVEFWGPVVGIIGVEGEMIAMGSSIFLEATATIEEVGMVARRGAGKSWKAVKEVSKIKIGKQSVGFIGMKITVVDISKSLVLEDNYFSFKEVLTDVLLGIGNKIIGKFTSDKTYGQVNGIVVEQVSKKTIIASIDDYFDYDTEAYNQISELEKSLENLGFL